MVRTVVQVAGMICGMCEAHVNDAIRNAFYVKKVTSSRIKEETVILSGTPLNHEKLRQAVSAAGYTVLSVREETEEKKKGWIASLLKRQQDC